MDEGQHALAATLLGAAESLRTAIGVPIPVADHRDHERVIGALRAALDDDAFRSAWELGRAMTIEQALDLALSSTRPLG